MFLLIFLCFFNFSFSQNRSADVAAAAEIGKNINVTDIKSNYGPLLNLFKVINVIKNASLQGQEISTEKLVTAAIKGMMNELNDPYSCYLDSEEIQRLNVELLDSSFSGGIGVMMIKFTDIIIVHVIEGSPADKAGLKKGDKITKINGEDVDNLTSNESVSKIKGKNGTYVTLTIKRGKSEDSSNKKGLRSKTETSDSKDTKKVKVKNSTIEEAKESKVFNVKVKRSVVEIDHITSKMIDENIGYIQLNRFAVGVADKLRAVLSDLKKRGAKYLIFDLRDNPGGTLQDAIAIASVFTDKNPIAGMETASQKEFYNSLGNADNEIPLVVMVNEGSASGSEIVADALKQHKRALLIGGKTYGKGTVQAVLALNKDDKDSDAIKLTTAHFLGPNGETINKKGVTPHIYVGHDSSAMKLVLDQDTHKNGTVKLGDFYSSILDQMDVQKETQLETAVVLIKSLKGNFSEIINGGEK